MSSNGLSAAALLMNVTSNERSKIARKISSKEFSHELTQLQHQTPMLGGPRDGQALRRTSPDSPAAPGNEGHLAPPALQTIPAGPDARTDTGGTAACAARTQETGRAGQNKARALSQQKIQEGLYFNDVVALERVMAQLKVPAEVRQACQGTGDKQGRISFKTLRSMLLSQPAVGGPNGLCQVSGKDVMDLVNSLSQLQNGVPASLEPLKTKPAGSYSLNELNNLLTNLVREIADKQQMNAPLAERKANTVPVPDLKPASTEIEPTIIPEGQVERLASQRVPTFSRAARGDSDKTWDGEARVSGSDDPSAPLEPVMKTSADEGSPAEGSPIPKLMGEAVRNDGAPPSPPRYMQTGTVRHDEKTATSSVEVQPASGRDLAEMRNPMAKGLELQTPETGVRVLDHHFAPGQPEAGVQVASHPETTVFATRSLHDDGQGEHAEADVEQLATTERHERTLGLEGRTMALEGKGTGGDSRDGEPNDSFRGADSKHRVLGQVVDNTDATPSGFEKALGGGEKVNPVRQTTAAGGVESELRLRLTESSWPDELSRKMEESHRLGRSHLTIELEPENLGKLVLRIEADRNHVSAWVSTQNEDAKTRLLHGSSSLRQHLEEQGLTLGRFTVDVGQQRGEQRYTQAGSNRGQGEGDSKAKRAQRVSLSGLRPVRDTLPSDRLISVFA